MAPQSPVDDEARSLMESDRASIISQSEPPSFTEEARDELKNAHGPPGTDLLKALFKSAGGDDSFEEEDVQENSILEDGPSHS